MPTVADNTAAKHVKHLDKGLVEAVEDQCLAGLDQGGFAQSRIKIIDSAVVLTEEFDPKSEEPEKLITRRSYPLDSIQSLLIPSLRGGDKNDVEDSILLVESDTLYHLILFED